MIKCEKCGAPIETFDDTVWHDATIPDGTEQDSTMCGDDGWHEPPTLPDAPEEYLESYREAMLWANATGYTPDGEFVSVDMFYRSDADQLAEEDQDAELTGDAGSQLAEDAASFWTEIVRIVGLTDTGEADFPSGYSAAQAGHDFALTRNGHGAGFWDRGIGELGERLTRAAKAHGESSLSVEAGEITLS